MTSRVGRLSPKGDAAEFDAALTMLEAALGAGSVPSEPLRDILNRLRKARPQYPTGEQITRLFCACHRLYGAQDQVEIVVSDGDRFGADWVRRSGLSLLEDTLFDERHDTRRFVETSVDHAHVLHPNHVHERTVHYQPAPHIPLHRDEAADLLAPYFAWLTTRRESDPFAHLMIAWNAVSQPLPPFEGLFWDWLDKIGEGDDMRLALSLHDLRERAQQRLSWSDFEGRLLPLLASYSPLLVAHAAGFIGSLYTDVEERMRGRGAWGGPRILDYIAGLPRHRRVAAGAFLRGIDAMDPDPFAELSRIAPGLNIADWVMMVLEDRVDEPYIPGSQAFWFYLHEHYDCDPDMVVRFVEAGHLYVAWMCITENHPPAPGMERALHLLAEGSDATYAEAARRLLNDMAEADASPET